MYLDILHIRDVRGSVVLTGTFVAGTVIGPTSTGVYKVDCSQYTNLMVIADFTIGSLTDASIKIESSVDGIVYSQETISSISSGVDTMLLGSHKMTATGIYEIKIPIASRFIKISAIGNGVVTGSLLAIDVVLSTR